MAYFGDDLTRRAFLTSDNGFVRQTNIGIPDDLHATDRAALAHRQKPFRVIIVLVE